MNNEKYGIILELITNKFKSQIKDIENTTSRASKKIQENMSIKPKMGMYGDYSKMTAQQVADAMSKGTGQKYVVKDLNDKLNQTQKITSKVNESISKTKANTSNIGENIKDGFGKGINTIKKFTFALFGIRGIYRLVTKAANAYLATNEELSNKIQSAWTGLGAILSPILEYLTNMLLKLVGLINQVITALFGVNLVAKAAAKSVKGAGSAANKSLASFDTIKNLNDSSSGGGSNPLSALTDGTLFTDLSEKFKKIFDVFQKAWKSKGERVITSMKSAFNNLKELGKNVGASLYEVWTNGTGQRILEEMMEQWALIFDIIGGIGKAMSDAWSKNNIGTSIIQSIADIFFNIQQIITNIGEQLKKWVLSKNFQKAVENTFKIFDDIFNIIKRISEWIKDMWNKYFSETFYKILDTLTSVYNAIAAIWEYLKPFVEWIVDKISKILEPMIEGIKTQIDDILDPIKKIADFVERTFSEQGTVGKILKWIENMIDKVKSAIERLNGKSATVKINADTSSFKKTIRNMISGVGKNVIKQLLGVTFPALQGWINSFDVGTNYVPNDQLAMVHKGEMIVPKKYNPATSGIGTGNNETNRLLNRLIVTLENKDMNAYISSSDVGRASVSYINEQSRIMGRKLI